MGPVLGDGQARRGRWRPTVRRWQSDQKLEEAAAIPTGLAKTPTLSLADAGRHHTGPSAELLSGNGQASGTTPVRVSAGRRPLMAEIGRATTPPITDYPQRYLADQPRKSSAVSAEGHGQARRRR